MAADMDIAADDAEVTAALAASALGAVPADLMARLLEGARVVEVPGGSTFRREAEPGRHLELVVAGLLRIYLMAPDGRTLTIRYCRVGSVMGAVSLFSVDYVMPGFIQALVASRLLVLRPDSVAELARVEAAVGLALNAELSERLRAFVAENPGQRLCHRSATRRAPPARPGVRGPARTRARRSHHPAGPGRGRRFGPRGRCSRAPRPASRGHRGHRQAEHHHPVAGTAAG